MVRKPLHSIGFLILAGMASAGCGDPPPMVAMTPPGFGPNILPKEAEEATAQALGEGIHNRSGATGDDVVASEERSDDSTSTLDPREPTTPGELRETETGLKYETITPGDGDVARYGDQVVVHYTGNLDANGEKGAQFDSSRGRGPASFTLARKRLIDGWIEGVPGMRVGEVRKLIVPPELGYGAAGTNGIPPNSTLIFEIELLKVER